MSNRPLYTVLASLLEARTNCAERGNTTWYKKHSQALERLQNALPSGSGFDNGTTVDLDKSNGSRLVLVTSFHHMHESGMYDGWTEHTVIVTPEFGGIRIRVTGRDRNQIKDYIGDAFDYCLRESIDESALYQEGA